MNSGRDFKARAVEVAQPLMAGGPVTGNQGGDYVVQSVALGSLAANPGSRGTSTFLAGAMRVRRLMPVECERLQGLPDNYTLIPKGNGFTADGPRYKQIGNGWARDVFEWVGGRIDAEVRRCEMLESATNDNVELALLLAVVG